MESEVVAQVAVGENERPSAAFDRLIEEARGVRPMGLIGVEWIEGTMYLSVVSLRA
jgi:hypothetical protein